MQSQEAHAMAALADPNSPSANQYAYKTEELHHQDRMANLAFTKDDVVSPEDNYIVAGKDGQTGGIHATNAILTQSPKHANSIGGATGT